MDDNAHRFDELISQVNELIKYFRQYVVPKAGKKDEEENGGNSGNGGSGNGGSSTGSETAGGNGGNSEGNGSGDNGGSSNGSDDTDQ